MFGKTPVRYSGAREEEEEEVVEAEEEEKVLEKEEVEEVVEVAEVEGQHWSVRPPGAAGHRGASVALGPVSVEKPRYCRITTIFFQFFLSRDRFLS